MPKLINCLILAGLLSACSHQIPCAETKSLTATPFLLDDGLRVDSPHPSKFDTAKLNNLIRKINSGEIHNVHSVLIHYNDALVFEKYWCGNDENHGKSLGNVQHANNRLHDVRSISKSTVALCIGIAIQQGKVKSIHDSIFAYLPEARKAPVGNLTIENLLTMSSGLEWQEIGTYDKLMNDESRMHLSLNPIKFILNRKQINTPGTVWNYNGGNTQLLAEIISRSTNQNIHEYAKANLFKPLRIEESSWTPLALKKTPAAASGLRLTSRSLLKLGLLCKDNGQFNGLQVVDSAWAKKCLRTHITRPDLSQFNLENGGYGLQFWTYDFLVGNQSIKVAEAKGNGGQAIFIIQQLNLVVVLTGGNYGMRPYNNQPSKILKEYILPAVIMEMARN